MDKHVKYRQSENGKIKRTAYQRQYMLMYRKTRKETGDPEPYSQRYHQNLRKKVFEKLGGAVCVECGCDEVSILEINHKNGGGNQLAKRRPLRQQHLDIVHERVNLDDYNVLCRICNAAHYVREMLGVQGHKVFWNSNFFGEIA